MFERLRNQLLRLLRVPPEPEPPFGNPASTKIFRASPKYFSFRLLGWSVGQLFALGGLIFGVVIMVLIEHKASEIRNQSAAEVAPAKPVENLVTEAKAILKQKSRNKRGASDVLNDMARFVAKVPPRWLLLIWLLKLAGVIFYFIQLVLTYAVLRLDYEMRWYVVTDRSLRIRTGVWKVQELTMSFANLQQVMLSRGPIQQLLGIADVRVQSAGGSSGVSHEASGHSASLHAGFFHGVDNAAEVRDLILARLRHFRETGLGDKDEVRQHATPPVTDSNPSGARNESAAVVAARELLAETRQLATALGVGGK